MLYTLLSFAGTWRYIIHVGFLCSRFSVNIRRRAVACPPPLWIDKFAQVVDNGLNKVAEGFEGDAC